MTKMVNKHVLVKKLEEVEEKSTTKFYVEPKKTDLSRCKVINVTVNEDKEKDIGVRVDDVIIVHTNQLMRYKEEENLYLVHEDNIIGIE